MTVDPAVPSQNNDVAPPRPEFDAAVPATPVRSDDRAMRAEATREVSDVDDAPTRAPAPPADPVDGPAGPPDAKVYPADTDSARAAVTGEDRALPNVDVPVLDDTTWYTAHDLDRYPRPLGAMRSRYPPEASGAMGEVTVLLAIDASGRIFERTVVDAQPPGVFDAAALAAFEELAFEPGMREGRAVRSRLLVKLRFSPSLGVAPDGAGGGGGPDPPSVGDSVTAR